MKSQNQNILKNRTTSILKFSIPIFILITMIACGHSAEDIEAYAASQNKAIMDSSVSSLNRNAKDRMSVLPVESQWSRTAELKFKVTDILKSTDAIETIAKQFNGLVIDTKLNTDIILSKQTAITKDSSRIANHYNRTNTMVLRVPNSKLDTILKCIASNAVFLDFRNIKSEDVSIQTLSNTLTQNRIQKTEARLETAIATKKSKLTEAVEAEKTLQNQTEEKDQALMDQYLLNDKIQWSTITLQLYEKENIQYEFISHEKTVVPYEPSLVQASISALSTGWTILTKSFVYLLNIWPILMACTALYFILKRRKIIKRATN